MLLLRHQMEDPDPAPGWRCWRAGWRGRGGPSRQTGWQLHGLLVADLADQDDVRCLAQEFLSATSKEPVSMPTSRWVTRQRPCWWTNSPGLPPSGCGRRHAGCDKPIMAAWVVDLPAPVARQTAPGRFWPWRRPAGWGQPARRRWECGSRCGAAPCPAGPVARRR